MRKLIFIALLPLLSASALSQTPFTAPEDMLNREGTSRSFYFGRWSGGRHMILERGFGDNTTRVFRSLSHRIDSTNTYTASTGVGRSWTSVSIGVSNATLVPRQTYSLNIQGAQTVVFSGKVTWPTIAAGTRGKNPSAFGGTNKEFSYSFRQPYVHRDENGLVLDFRFFGGTLANGASWSGSTSSNYYLDGQSISTLVRDGVLDRQVPAASTCNDSAWTSATGAESRFTARIFSDDYTTVQLRGLLRANLASFNTAPNQIEVHALGLPVSGVPFPNACVGTGLYVNLAGPSIVVAFRHARRSSDSGAYVIDQPQTPQLYDVQVAHQVAWLDSVTGLLGLTRASFYRLPDGPPPAGARWTIQDSNQASVKGTRFTTSNLYAPVFRYN